MFSYSLQILYANPFSIPFTVPSSFFHYPLVEQGDHASLVFCPFPPKLAICSYTLGLVYFVYFTA
jgi:hypothetical protein